MLSAHCDAVSKARAARADNRARAGGSVDGVGGACGLQDRTVDEHGASAMFAWTVGESIARAVGLAAETGGRPPLSFATTWS